jgi:hypothetical protein
MTANLSVFYSNDITFVHTVPLENLNSFLTRLVKTLHFVKYVVDTHVRIVKSAHTILVELLICWRNYFPCRTKYLYIYMHQDFENLSLVLQEQHLLLRLRILC